MCRKGLFPWFCPFSERRIIPVWACGSPTDPKWLLGGVFGALGTAERGAGQRSRSFGGGCVLPGFQHLPSPVFWAETGPWAGKKSGTWAGFGLGWGDKKINK